MTAQEIANLEIQIEIVRRSISTQTKILSMLKLYKEHNKNYECDFKKHYVIMTKEEEKMDEYKTLYPDLFI